MTDIMLTDTDVITLRRRDDRAIHVVVLMTDGECKEYAGRRCIMTTYGPYTYAQCERIAERSPAWAAPHIMTLREWEETNG